MPAYKFTGLPAGRSVTVRKVSDGTSAGSGTVDSAGVLSLTLAAGDYYAEATDYRGRTVRAHEELVEPSDLDALASGTYALRSRLRGGPIIPAGKKLRGANLVPKPSGPIVGGTGLQGWNEVWTEWDWFGWIKPQIDAAETAGANAVRMIGAAGAVLHYTREGATARALPEPTYLDRWRQLIEYARTLGMHVYPCGGDFASMPSGFTQAELIAHLQALAAVVDEHAHVIGLDVVQEAHYAVGNGNGPSGVSGTAAVHTYLQSVVEAVRGATTLPLTCSQGTDRAASNKDLFADVGGTLTTAAGYLDFLDFHCYYSPAAGDVSPALAVGKPVIVGETGSSLANAAAVRAAQLTAAGKHLANVVDATFVWSIVDNANSNASNFGLYGAGFAPRATEVAAFATWPTSAPAPVVIVPAVSMVAAGGAPALGQTGWALDSTSEETILGHLAPPADWSTFHVDLLWSNAGASAGDVVWRFDLTTAEPGQVFGAVVVVFPDVTAMAGAQNVLISTRLASSVQGSGDYTFKLRRRAAVAGDTLPNDAAAFRLRLTKSP